MPETTTPLAALTDWKTVLGEQPLLGAESSGRELWSVTAEDGARYFLKRLGPWRNLPLADEARVLRHLATHGVPVAEFVPTDRATLYAGAIEDSFVLIPKLANDPFDATELVPLEATIGGAMATLHRALGAYPRSANSYTETLAESLADDLDLPDDLDEAFAERRDSMIAALSSWFTAI
jgi:Ser/Thr protein kinase RdoA (MazF antagonist)